MDRPTFKWWINRNTEMEKELQTWKMYCQQLAGDIDHLEERLTIIKVIAKDAMKTCRINHDDYDTVESCVSCFAVKAFEAALND